MPCQEHCHDEKNHRPHHERCGGRSRRLAGHGLQGVQSHPGRGCIPPKSRTGRQQAGLSGQQLRPRLQNQPDPDGGPGLAYAAQSLLLLSGRRPCGHPDEPRLPGHRHHHQLRQPGRTGMSEHGPAKQSGRGHRPDLQSQPGSRPRPALYQHRPAFPGRGALRGLR